jgi:VWFA-related protein
MAEVDHTAAEQTEKRARKQSDLQLLCRRGSVTAIAFAVFIAFAQTSPPQLVLHTAGQEVLLDFIARDKHQKLVMDLRADEIEVFEDGAPQTLRSFEYRGERREAARQNEPIPPRAAEAAAPQALREINLVSLVFEGVDAVNRREATQAAKDFLANEVTPNTYIGVFTLNHRLALLQQYTNDAALLNKAVNRALTGAYQQFARDTEAEVMKLNQLNDNQARFQPLRPGSAEERGPAAVDRIFTPVERNMVELTLTILTNQFGNLSMDALERLIEAQVTLPGRKTIVYFSPGLIVPPQQPERFRAVISAANRANIAFYTVDPTGLDTASSVSESRILNGAINSIDMSPGAKQTNFSENLRTLAEDTGGFAISNTNDARLPLRHVMEEVRAHYEATYAPTSANYDGRSHHRSALAQARNPFAGAQGILRPAAGCRNIARALRVRCVNGAQPAARTARVRFSRRRIDVPPGRAIHRLPGRVFSPQPGAAFHRRQQGQDVSYSCGLPGAGEERAGPGGVQNLARSGISGPGRKTRGVRAR